MLEEAVVEWRAVCASRERKVWSDTGGLLV